MYSVLFVLLCVIVSHTIDTVLKNVNSKSIKKNVHYTKCVWSLMLQYGSYFTIKCWCLFWTALTEIVEYESRWPWSLSQEILFVSVQLEYFALHVTLKQSRDECVAAVILTCTLHCYVSCCVGCYEVKPSVIWINGIASRNSRLERDGKHFVF